MNTFGLLALGGLLGSWTVGLAADILNLRALIRHPLPQAFWDTYSPEEYSRSRRYTGERIRFGMLISVVDLAALLLFWFLGGFGAVHALARSTGWGGVLEGALFLALLLVLRGILSLPFGIYATFGLEAKYGFNRTTPRTFAADLFKNLLLGVLVGGPILLGGIALFRGAGSLGWLACWAAAAGVALVVQFLAPQWILPLFNRFTPLEDGELRQAVIAYAERVGFPLGGVSVVDGSKRTAKANAFFTGFGSMKRVALYDTLIARYTTGELVAVLAHEIGHYRKKHVLERTLLGILQIGVLLFLVSRLIDEAGLYTAFLVPEPSIGAGLALSAVLLSPLDLLLGILLHARSRRNEYAADRFAAETTGMQQDLRTALIKLSAESYSHLTPHPLSVVLRASHPPVVARLEALAKVTLP